MTYRVDYLVRGRVDASEKVGSLQAARGLATVAVEKGLADAVEVRMGVKLLLRRPRTLRKA